MNEKKSILVVDDSKTVNSFISESLKNHNYNYNVDSAFDIQQAKEKLSKNSYDFIILDLILPDGNGKELLFKIPKKTTKVIILTSNDDVKLREHFFQIGILDYFSKNNPLDYIVKQIIYLISKLEVNSSYKILLIEKNLLIKNLIENVFLLRNYKVLNAENANEGLYKLRHFDINLVILNLKLPDLKTEDILYEIRKNSDFVDLPIVGISSAFLDTYKVAEILKNGVNVLIQRPFSIEELIVKSEVMLNLNIYQNSLNKKNEELKRINIELEERVKKSIKKQMQQEKLAFYQSRMAAMGEMMSMIAHQWRQPLTVISAASSDIKIKKELGILDDESLMQNIDSILYRTQKMSETINDFMNFFKPNKDREKFNFNVVIDEVIKLIKPQFESRGIKFIIEIEDNYIINGYKNELEQVLLNILSNARDAYEDKIGIEKIVEISTQKINRLLTISIKDRAGGVDNELLNKIFEPYVTTKEEGKGTGVGLYMSKTIIQRSFRGDIEALNYYDENDRRIGAIFNISIEIN